MKACQILSVQFSCWWLVVKILFCCWQDTEQRLLRLAVDGLESARAAVRFAEEQWQQAILSKDREQESKWKQEVKEAEQKVEKAKQEVQARASPTVEARWL